MTIPTASGFASAGIEDMGFEIEHNINTNNSNNRINIIMLLITIIRIMIPIM